MSKRHLVKMSALFRNPILLSCIKQHKIYLVSNTSNNINQVNVRLFGNNSRNTFGRTYRASKQTIAVPKSRSLKEILTQPTTGAPFSIGAGAVAGASFLGLGALCYYGLGLSNQASTYENSL